MVCEAAAASGGGGFRCRARTRNTNDILTPLFYDISQKHRAIFAAFT